MAKVHFAKDGLNKQGEAITESTYISTNNLQMLFSGYDFRFFANAPRINADKLANEFGPYQHVVLEIEEWESTNTFQKVGYYYIPSLSVIKCKELIDKVQNA